MATQYGWLIEADSPRGGLTYLCVSAYGKVGWTSGAGTALRFARKEDAENFWRLAEANCLSYVRYDRIAEHAWDTDDAKA